MVSVKLAEYLAIALVMLACQQPPPRSATQGHLEVSWSGKDRGRVSGAATARWCELRRVLQIQTVRGDTGIALALYPGRALAPGTYKVVDPARAESLPPAAGVAVRWLGQTIVQGFRGDTGRVVLDRSPTGQWSGRLSARARSVVDTQRLALGGTFRDLVVTRDSLGCAPLTPVDDESDIDDTGVD
jgi:hypothetical protein